jgi:hypothetical protein
MVIVELTVLATVDENEGTIVVIVTISGATPSEEDVTAHACTEGQCAHN